MKQIISISILIISVVLIEASALSNWQLLPVMPDIMLLATIYIGMKNGPIIGQVTGFFSGLMIDFLSASPFGLNSMIRTILGFFSGMLHLNVHTKGIVIPSIIAVIATISKAVLLFIISFFYPNKIVLYSLFSSTLWFECVFNAVLAPVIFGLLSMFSVLSIDYSRSNINDR